MISFTPATEADIPQISTWIQADADHKNTTLPEFFLTASPGSFAAGRVEDEHGIAMYVRLEKESDLVRIHLQFAPESEVSKRRVAVVLTEGLARFIETIPTAGFVFESVNPPLISFLEKLGYVRVAETNDYLLTAKPTSAEQESAIA